MKSQRCITNRLIAQFIVLLLLVPALVPQGMMLARNAQTDTVEITICSGFNSRTVWLDLETGALIDPSGKLSLPVSTAAADHLPADDPSAASSSLCPFALAGAALLVQVVPVPEILPGSNSIEPVPAGEDPLAVPYLHLPSRGPPILS
ncbi:MAG: hypothetical protein ACFHX7_08670 [Pseudomonadota bacterium]